MRLLSISGNSFTEIANHATNARITLISTIQTFPKKNFASPFRSPTRWNFFFFSAESSS